MSIITLTSDWGHQDYYVGAVKGTILRHLPDARIIDISHEIPPFDLKRAAFVLKNCYQSFPAGSVHIVGVNTEASIQSPHMAIEYQGHFFIGADNGLFPMIFDAHPSRMVEIEMHQESDYFTFPARDVFAQAAALLADGKPLEHLGATRTKLRDMLMFKPVATGNILKGRVIFVDHYGNLITNVSHQQFKAFGQKRSFVIKGRPSDPITEIEMAYSDVNEGEMVALFGANGLLEIAIRQGHAANLLGMGMDDVITIEFADSSKPTDLF